MADEAGKPTDFYNALFLKRCAFNSLPDALRAWSTLGVTIALLALIVCVLVSTALLVRLGWDALWTPSPAYQEIAKNFLLAFVGAFGAPFLVWRTWVAHTQAKAAAEQARVALENHITGIFSKSVELMGSVRDIKKHGADGAATTVSSPNIEARLGALYSLERILHESTKDQRAILETICAYIRENSPLDIPTDSKQSEDFYKGRLPPRPSRRADVQAAITIVGRRSLSVRERAAAENWVLDFRDCNLVAYDFSALNYDRANFGSAFLDEAKMHHGSFKHSLFAKTFLRKADLSHAAFHASSFVDCDIKDAVIDDTDFGASTIINTDLRTSNVKSLNIESADLSQAFGSYFDFVVQNAKEEGPNHFNAREIVSLYELIKKARFDDKTKVSTAVSEAVTIMNSAKKPDA
jgi:uncharacterized protein YjbI with pentapeptide repeats